jgi:putative phosphoesterase
LLVSPPYQAADRFLLVESTMPPTYRLAVMADIHGNLPGFEAVMADLQQYQPLDGFLVAGDVVGGPGQETILQRLMELKAVMVQGNGEELLLSLADGGAPEYICTAQQFALIRWTYAHLSPQSLAFLHTIPLQRVFTLPEADPIYIVHRSNQERPELANLSGVRELADEMLALAPEPVVVFGHTHWPCQVRRGSRQVLNPGAVMFPENGYIGAQYALLNWDRNQWEAELHSLPYDLNHLRQDYEESGFLDTGPLARVYIEDVFRGKDTLHAFANLCRKLAVQAGVECLPYFPDAIWKKAAETFPWDSSLVE